MKALSIEKMETIEGGFPVPTIEQSCGAFAFATVVNNGLTFGSYEAYIISIEAYDFCIESAYNL